MPLCCSCYHIIVNVKTFYEELTPNYTAHNIEFKNRHKKFIITMHLFFLFALNCQNIKKNPQYLPNWPWHTAIRIRKIYITSNCFIFISSQAVVNYVCDLIYPGFNWTSSSRFHEICFAKCTFYWYEKIQHNSLMFSIFRQHIIVMYLKRFHSLMKTFYWGLNFMHSNERLMHNVFVTCCTVTLQTFIEKGMTHYSNI